MNQQNARQQETDMGNVCVSACLCVVGHGNEAGITNNTKRYSGLSRLILNRYSNPSFSQYSLRNLRPKRTA